ncbi:MAG: MFS transporter [Planctomycetaceae bacterium]
MSQRIVLVLLAVLAIITYLDRLCIAALGPRIQAELGLSPAHWGWVLGAFTMAYGAFEIPSGALGDRFGHRLMLTRIVVWWSVFTALTGFASSFASLLVVRFLFGAGEAGAFPNISGSASRWFAPTQRARVQGFVWGASRLGAILAPLLVGQIIAGLGNWRAVFWIFGSVGVVWAAVWYAWYREPVETPVSDGTDLAGRAGASGHIRVDSIPWRRLFSSRKLWLIMVMYSFYVWGSTFYLTWLHTYLVKGRGLSEKEMTLLSTLPFVLGALANPLGGFLSDLLSQRLGLKLGRRLMGVTCLVLSAAFLLATAASSGKWSGIILLSLGFGCLDLALPSAWAVCMDVGGKYAGAASGAMNSFGHVGGTLCSVLFGYCVEHFHSYDVPLVVIALMLLVSAALFSQIDSSQPVLFEEEPIRLSAVAGPA